MFFNNFKYKNWKKELPSNFIQYMFTPAPNGLRLINFMFQKVFRINSKVKFMVHYTSRVTGVIVLGKGVVKSFCNSGGCYIQGTNGINIGDNSIFAPGVKIISANHDLNDLSKHKKSSSILIGENCWLGANAIILPGVELGDNVIVAAGAVVNSSFKSNVVIGGVPAKVLKEL